MKRNQRASYAVRVNAEYVVYTPCGRAERPSLVAFAHADIEGRISIALRLDNHGERRLGHLLTGLAVVRQEEPMLVKWIKSLSDAETNGFRLIQASSSGVETVPSDGGNHNWNAANAVDGDYMNDAFVAMQAPALGMPDATSCARTPWSNRRKANYVSFRVSRPLEILKFRVVLGNDFGILQAYRYMDALTVEVSDANRPGVVTTCGQDYVFDEVGLRV